MDNELPPEDFAVPTLKTLKELLWAEEDQQLADFLTYHPDDTPINLRYDANGAICEIAIKL